MRAFPEVVRPDQWKVETGVELMGEGAGIDWKEKVFRIPESPDAPQMHRELLIQLRMGNKYDARSMAKKIKQSPLSAAVATGFQTGLTYYRIFGEPLVEPLATTNIKSLLGMMTPDNVPPSYRFACAALNQIKSDEALVSNIVRGVSVATDDFSSQVWRSLGIEPDMVQLKAGKDIVAAAEALMGALLYFYIPKQSPDDRVTLNGGIKYIAKWLDKLLQQTGPDATERHIPEHELAQVGWGKVTWEECPMYVPAKFRTLLDHRRKLDTGVVPKHIGRLLSDQRLFDIKRKRPGGSVLIDTSGSMGLSEDDIDKLVMAAPGCTVAVYGGMHGDDGRMRLLASKGYVAERQYRTRAGCGANLIDGPALMWLAKQNEPRFWVSDGLVTGTNECSNATLKAESIYICKRYHIKRVDDVDDALRTFRRTTMIT